MRMTPVRKGLVEDPLGWKWSSVRWLAETAGPIKIDHVRLPLDAKARIDQTAADLAGAADIR